MKSFKSIICLILVLLNSPLLQAKDSVSLRYNNEEIKGRKSLDDVYARFGKIYKPYVASQSNLNEKTSKQLERIFTLTDMAVIEKVLLLEFIGKVDKGDVPRDAPHRNYYSEIIQEIESFETKDKRMIKLKKDLVTGIKFHVEVLEAWLLAARDNEVSRVKNKSGRWVHPGTSAGDKIFYSLYHSFVKENFKEEYPENLEALSRHFCVLVF